MSEFQFYRVGDVMMELGRRRALADAEFWENKFNELTRQVLGVVSELDGDCEVTLSCGDTVVTCRRVEPEAPSDGN